MSELPLAMHISAHPLVLVRPQCHGRLFFFLVVFFCAAAAKYIHAAAPLRTPPPKTRCSSTITSTHHHDTIQASLLRSLLCGIRTARHRQQRRHGRFLIASGERCLHASDVTLNPPERVIQTLRSATLLTLQRAAFKLRHPLTRASFETRLSYPPRIDV